MPLPWFVILYLNGTINYLPTLIDVYGKRSSSCRGFFPDRSNGTAARLTLSTQYIAAVKESVLESTDQSLRALKQTLDGDAKLVRIISSPTLSPADKSAIISVIAKSGDKTIKNLLEALAENNRLGMLGGVIDKFAVLMGAHRGEIEAVVTSAVVGPLMVSR